MQYSFRLAELMGHAPDPRKRPGTIKTIVDYTGLDRHQVAALLKNEIKYIPLQALSRLCDYLVDYGHVAAEKLPGALFAIEPENFWELLARRKRLELCVGVRRDVVEDSDVSFVVAADSVLLGELLNGVTTLGGTAKLRRSETSNSETSESETSGLPTEDELPRPDQLKQSLVWSPGQATEEEVIQRAHRVYNTFSDSNGDKAFVGIGSTKSNPAVEIVLARAFNCDPFVSQDDVKNASQRSLPFFLRYRDRDPHPASCVGGLKLCRGSNETTPGIYFEDAAGKWSRFTTNSPNEEVAFVFYIHRESQGRLEMVMGGFSGRATRLLARSLAARANDFWPPTFSTQGMQIGAFIVQYDAPVDLEETDILRVEPLANSIVTPIPVEAMARRLEQ